MVTIKQDGVRVGSIDSGAGWLSMYDAIERLDPWQTEPTVTDWLSPEEALSHARAAKQRALHYSGRR